MEFSFSASRTNKSSHRAGRNERLDIYQTSILKMSCFAYCAFQSFDNLLSLLNIKNKKSKGELTTNGNMNNPLHMTG